MLDLLIVNGTVIPVDPEHHIYAPGYVGIQGERIACLGEMAALPVLPPAKRVLDAAGHAVLPGLVDAHGHAGHCLVKTYGEHRQGWGVMAEDLYYHATDNDFWYAEGALAAAERIKFGVTTGVSMLGSTPRIDSIEPVGANLAGSIKVGIRQLTGIGCANGPWPKTARIYTGEHSYREETIEPERAYETTEAAVKAYNGVHPRQTCIVAPGQMGLRSGESPEANIRHNKQMYRIAKTYGVPLHTHAYGGAVQFLHDTTPEILDYTLSLTHSTGYSQEELRILAASNSYVLHGPTTRAHIRKFCPVYEMLRQGIKVAVVTDGTAPDRSYDLWRDMKNVMLLQRAWGNHTGILPAGRALELCTIEPARALGLGDELGSLEVGKMADVILVNVQQPHLAPFGLMPVQRLVYHAMGQDVDTVIVGGELVMQGRRLLLCDEQRILRDAESAFATMMRRFGHPEFAENPRLYELSN